MKAFFGVPRSSDDRVGDTVDILILLLVQDMEVNEALVNRSFLKRPYSILEVT